MKSTQKTLTPVEEDIFPLQANEMDIEYCFSSRYPGFQRIFFLIDTDGSRRSRVNEEKNNLS